MSHMRRTMQRRAARIERNKVRASRAAAAATTSAEPENKEDPPETCKEYQPKARKEDPVFSPHDLNISSFIPEAEISRSPLARVVAAKVRCRPDGLIAMKIYRKTRVLRQGFLPTVMTEFNVYKRIETMKRANNAALDLSSVDEAYAFFHDERRLYLVTPLHKANLDSLSCFTSLPEWVVQQVVVQMASGVASLHRMGIIHRNLKPSSILLSRFFTVIITDFGLAYLHEFNKTIGRKTVKLCEWCGTVEYLAPEILMRQKHGNMIDYWAIGVLMYKMMRNKVPFEDPSDLAAYYKHPHSGTAQYWMENEGFSKAEAEVLAALLHCDPAQRSNYQQLLNMPYFSSYKAPADIKRINDLLIAQDEIDAEKLRSMYANYEKHLAMYVKAGGKIEGRPDLTMPDDEDDAPAAPAAPPTFDSDASDIEDDDSPSGSQAAKPVALDAEMEKVFEAYNWISESKPTRMNYICGRIMSAEAPKTIRAVSEHPARLLVN